MQPLHSHDFLEKCFVEPRQPIHVLVIDDSVFTLRGLRSVLSKKGGRFIVSEGKTESEAFAALQTCRTDVVVLDVSVGGVSGIDLCRTIRDSCPNTAVLIFTLSEDPNILRAAILAGANGYLLKNASGDAMAQGIELVSEGKAIIDRQLTQHILTWMRDEGRGVSRNMTKGCSNEDLSVLSLVAEGKTNKQIAQELGNTWSAVTTRLQRIYKRLGISRKSEAARYFVQVERGAVHRTVNYSARCSASTRNDELRGRRKTGGIRQTTEAI